MENTWIPWGTCGLAMKSVHAKMRKLQDECESMSRPWVFHGNSWNSMEIIWTSSVVHGFLWEPMELHGNDNGTHQSSMGFW